MADNQRIYSEEEIALILRKAAELASRSELGDSSAGLTLEEMKMAAAEAGLDPALVERAAQLVAATAARSRLEWLTGGPLRHDYAARFPVKLDEDTAAMLLSSIRINASRAGYRDTGHSSPQGMTWHDGGEIESLGVTARPDGDGTAVSVALDRRSTFGLMAAFSGMAAFLVVLFGMYGLYPESAALGIGGGITGVGGILAAARGFWSISTRRVRERINGVMDAVGNTLSQPTNREQRLLELDEDAGTLESDSNAVNDAKRTRA